MVFIIISKKISRINVLIWAGLRHSVPSHLKTTKRTFSTTPLSFRIDNKHKILNSILYTNSKLYKIVILRMINVLSVNQNQKRYLISSSIVCTPSFSGNSSNPITIL